MFREMVEGIVELLMARASIKSEARLPLTTIRPVLNNPLKFSVGADDALRKLFGAERAAGFLAPEEAVRDAVQDLKAHQLAVIAGLQATLKDLFNRFDPERLEREFSERSLLGTILPLHRKAKCWTLFTDEFRKIAREAEDDFQRLFGREFARAYQEQVRRMRAGDGSEGPRLGPRAGRAAARTAGSAPAVRVW
jgi:type VI secretion system protein